MGVGREPCYVRIVHEVALSTQLAQVVSRAAAGRTVRQVRVEVGALRQVVPETLAYAWRFVIQDTPLHTARLQILPVPLRLQCVAGHLTEVSGELDFSCPRCDAPTHIVSGEEFRVVDIDVD